MTSSKNALLITTINDIETVRKLSTYRDLIAGSYNVKATLQRSGIEAIAPGTIWDESEKSETLWKVSQIGQLAERAIDQSTVSPEQRATMLSTLVQSLFKWLGCQSLGRLVGKSIAGFDVPSSIMALPGSNWERLNADFSHNSGPYRNYVIFLRKTLQQSTLDLRSPSGSKLNSQKPKLRSFRISSQECASEKIAIRTWLHNLRQFYGCQGVAPYFQIHLPKATSPRLPVYSEKIISELNDLGSGLGDLRKFTAQTLENSSIRFSIFYAAMMQFLIDANYVPNRALFNHVESEEIAGFAAALKDRGTLTTMSSHGAVVAHGGNDRRIISTILADSIYNSHPAMREISPRSPLQMSRAWAGNVIRQNRMRERINPKQKSKDKPFRVVYAPNFLAWHQCFHGLSASCFETRACAEHLSRTVVRMPEVDLYIRIKTTTADTPTDLSVGVGRGLVPSDIADLIDETSGVYDASRYSHSGLLASADLIITEGFTAVMFEALEYRKPVLLLNLSSARTPSLPALKAVDLAQTQCRNAVYSSSCDDNLEKILMQILNKHQHEELTEEEVRPYVWT